MVRVLAQCNGVCMLTVVLSGQLKVNLRPVWSPATGALSLISERFGDLVWRLLFWELRAVSEGRGGEFRPEWMGEGDDGMKDDWEEERSWRDPSAHKLREVVARLGGDKSSLVEFVKVIQRIIICSGC